MAAGVWRGGDGVKWHQNNVSYHKNVNISAPYAAASVHGVSVSAYVYRKTRGVAWRRRSRSLPPHCHILAATTSLADNAAALSTNTISAYAQRITLCANSWREETPATLALIVRNSFFISSLQRYHHCRSSWTWRRRRERRTLMPRTAYAKRRASSRARACLSRACSYAASPSPSTLRRLLPRLLTSAIRRRKRSAKAGDHAWRSSPFLTLYVSGAYLG